MAEVLVLETWEHTAWRCSCKRIGATKFVGNAKQNSIDLCNLRIRFRWLGLRSLNKQFKPGGTAAPNYQMPYRVIKKSSSRITEERNTFSRSNTVSEVLGTTEAARMDQPPLKSSKYDGDTNYVRIAKKFLCCCLGS